MVLAFAGDSTMTSDLPMDASTNVVVRVIIPPQPVFATQYDAPLTKTVRSGSKPSLTDVSEKSDVLPEETRCRNVVI